MADFQDSAKKAEIDFLNIAADLLESGNITINNAKAAAREFLNMLPFKSEEDLLQKIKDFCVKYPQFENEYTHLLSGIDEEKTGEVLTKLRSYINIAK